jgi:predicted RNA-binding protein YlxR (DUF448 family)
MVRPGRQPPQRTCVACGSKADKRDLLRIVAPKDGPAHIDPTGKSPGRGAYTCRECLASGRTAGKGRLSYALRRGLTDEEWTALTQQMTAVIG